MNAGTEGVLTRAISATGRAAWSASGGNCFLRARTATSPAPAVRALIWMSVPRTEATVSPPAAVTRRGAAEQGTRLPWPPHSREKRKVVERRAEAPTASVERSAVAPGGTCSKQRPAWSEYPTALGDGRSEMAIRTAATTALIRRA